MAQGFRSVQVIVQAVPCRLENSQFRECRAEFLIGGNGIRSGGVPELYIKFGQAVQRGFSVFQRGKGEIQRTAVIAPRQHVPDRGRPVAQFVQIRQRVHVAQGFGHLASVHQQVRDVEPQAREAAAAGAAGLGHFVFMVGEYQIHAAGVEIKVIAEVFMDHGGAFQVPAGAAFSPGRGPEVVSVFRPAALPQHEVCHGVFFIFVCVGPGIGGFS